MLPLKTADPEIYTIITKEQERQKNGINLIASENYASTAVLEATGSVLTNKYAEGYPGKRYYAGCEFVDQAELLAIERAKQLFNAEHANVQPHAGSQANLAVYTAALKPGDTIMGMSLMAGGHLTHGHKVNLSGCLYNVVHYGVDPETELLNYETIADLAHTHKPKLIIAGASAYSRIIDFEKLSLIAKSVNAYFMADIAHIAGLVVTDLHPSPIPHAEFVTSTTHKTLRGPRGGLVLCKQNFAESVDRAIMPGTQGGPFMHAIAAKAVAFKLAQSAEFKTYQQQVVKNAHVMAQEFSTIGYRIVSGGTDNHLFVVDLSNTRLTGRAAELVLERVGIYVSRSCIPFDTKQPWVTSGIRIGTPAVTSRGIDTHQAKTIVHYINEALKKHDQESALAALKKEIAAFAGSLNVIV